MSSKKQTVLTETDKENLLAHSPYVLPDNPSSKNFSASQIKKSLYEAYLVLFDFISRAITENNQNVDLNDAQITTILGYITTLQGYFTDGKANKAIADEDNNNIKSTYDTKAHVTEVIGMVNQLSSDILDGTKIAKKAECDASGNEIKGHYLADLNVVFTKTASTNTIRIQNINKKGYSIGTLKTVQFDGANVSNAGLLLPEDKSKIDAIANDIAISLATAKSYTDDKVSRSNLVSVIGEASNALNGLMSATDKARLDTIFSSFNDDDQDTIVNKLKEVLAVFDQYPEGTSLINALALKCNISDIVDNVTSNYTNKPLSANQGKVLKDLIDTKLAPSDIIDAINSTDTTKPLSAKQGKVLKDFIDTKANSIDVDTKSEVNTKIQTAISGISRVSVITDEDNSKNYTFQLKVRNGKPVLALEEIII